jgi:hypothetical protein
LPESSAHIENVARPDSSLKRAVPSATWWYHLSVLKRTPKFRRRRLSAVVRRAITSYYTSDEQMEIERAAKQLRISKSSFVASAALKEARRLAR